MDDLSFQNNVRAPSLAGKELPAFKFELEKSKGKVLGNSIYESIGLSPGIAENPVDVLATNFNKPESLTPAFPRKGVFIAPGE